MPHNWGVDKAQSGDKNFFKGIGWYQKQLDVKPKTGKRYFLRFQGVSTIANVYINGKHLGEHRGSFGVFCFDITKFISDKRKNILTVKVDNNKPKDVAPLRDDFNVYGGIYRSVELIETSEINFIFTYHASPRVTWSQTSVSEDKAIIDVSTIISNPTKGLAF